MEPTEPTPPGDAAPSPTPSFDDPEIKAWHARCDADLERSREILAEALAEAERRGVPLHEIIPVS